MKWRPIAVLFVLGALASSAGAQGNLTPPQILRHDASLTGAGTVPSPAGVHVATGGGLTTNGGTTGLGLGPCPTGQGMVSNGTAYACGDIASKVAGTFHRVAVLTPDGSHVGDSSALWDDGSSHIGVGTTSPAQLLDIQLGGSPTGTAGIPVQLTEIVAAPSISFRRQGGTLASPTAVGSLDYLAQLRADGYGTTGWATLPQVFLEVANAEAGSPTATARATNIKLRTVPIGATASLVSLRIGASGHVGIGQGVWDSVTVPALLDAVGLDSGAGAGTSTTAWDGAWSIVAENSDTTSPGLGLAFSQTDQAAKISASHPGTGFLPLDVYASSIRLNGPIVGSSSAQLGGALAMTSHKITGLANGTASDDAAAFGQIGAAVSAAVVGTSGRSARFTATNAVGNGSFTDDGAGQLALASGGIAITNDTALPNLKLTTTGAGYPAGPNAVEIWSHQAAIAAPSWNPITNIGSSGEITTGSWILISGTPYPRTPPTSDPSMLAIVADIVGPAIQVTDSGLGAGAYIFSAINHNTRNYVMTIESDGGLKWGNGATYASLDTNLYRTGASALKTDGALAVGGALGVTGLSTLTGGFTLGADSSASSHKITNLTNGSSAQDAAAFGQIATAVNAAVSGTSGKSARFSGTHVLGSGAFTDDGTNATIAGTFGVSVGASGTGAAVGGTVVTMESAANNYLSFRTPTANTAGLVWDTVSNGTVDGYLNYSESTREIDIQAGGGIRVQIAPATTTINNALHLVGAGTFDSTLAVASTFTNAAHIISLTSGGTPTALGCGTGMTITGTDSAMIITPGTGLTSGACALSFAHSYTNIPACTANATNIADGYITVTATNASLLVADSTRSDFVGKVTVTCTGINGT